MNKRELFKQLQQLTTEKRNKNSMNIDLMKTADILRLINREDHKIPDAVKKEIPHIEKAVELVVNALKKGGRLIYIGAGTSGRLGVLDAVECPPTFGTDPSIIRGIIAGGKTAMFRAKEGSEDDENDAKKRIKNIRLKEKDVVCGIAASLRTPFVISALRESKKQGASTIMITTNPRKIIKEKNFSYLRKLCDVLICPEVGPEIIMGSTRMKSGTAQKMILNMITTTAMIKMGKVYENLMVDLRMNSKKLEERAKRILMIVTGVNYKSASLFLRRAGGNVKTAIVMAKLGISKNEAEHRLKISDGFVKKAIKI